jgi:hypothetical protein
MLNDSQSKALQVQIQDLQQSMEVLVLEKTNTTARYQLKKVEVEARITRLLNRLLEEATVVLK